MTALEWSLIAGLGAIYLAMMFTVAVMTLQKKHIALFVAGFFLPFCWLIGAVIKPAPGSNYQGPMG